jgi:hypothetical protein
VALTVQRASERVAIREYLVELSSLPMEDTRQETLGNRKSKSNKNKNKNKDNSTMLGAWLLQPHGVRVSSFRTFWFQLRVF